MSWLQNTFQGLLFKNVAFNLTIQALKQSPKSKLGLKAERHLKRKREFIFGAVKVLNRQQFSNHKAILSTSFIFACIFF